MSTRIQQLREHYRSYGLLSALLRAVRSLLGISTAKKYHRFTRRLEGRDHVAVFSEIYKRGLWKLGDSPSGAGSELIYTENLRFFLPILFDRFGVRTIIDAPCGDFNWMRMVPLKQDMSYVGVDIVPQVIVENQRRYGDRRHSFLVANMVNDPLPPGDILLCRDCLFHLSNADIFALLRNFINSGIPFFLTNTHVSHGAFTNTDIRTGEFRLIDLFSAPFYFPSQVHYRIADFIDPFPPREMCLWDRGQISEALESASR